MKIHSYRDTSVLYVCPGCSGSGKTCDKNAGGDAPLGDLDSTFPIIEQMRGSGMLQPITVKLMAGAYCLSHAVRIKDTMSNVTVEPFGDGEVLISGRPSVSSMIFFRQRSKFHHRLNRQTISRERKAEGFPLFLSHRTPLTTSCDLHKMKIKKYRKYI